jgi:hypothetical protein
MPRRSVLLILTLSGLLAAFAAGVLVSRPAAAQGLQTATWLGPFPRQSDLWSIEVHPAAMAIFQTPIGQLSGFHLTVQPDAHGRLPVVTQLHRQAW